MQQGSDDDAVPQLELVDARPRVAAGIRPQSRGRVSIDKRADTGA